MKYIVSISALVGVVLLAGCALPSYEMGRFFEDPGLARELSETVRSRFPARFTLIQRRLVDRSGRQLVFTEYLSVNRTDGSLRVAALNDVGAKVYVAGFSNRSVRVEYLGPGLPEQAVHAFVLDSVRLYLDSPASWAILVRHSDATLGLYSVQADQTATEFRFTAADQRMIGYRLSRGNRLLYEADWEGTGETSLPAQVRIRHHRGGYAASLRPKQLSELPSNP